MKGTLEYQEITAERVAQLLEHAKGALEDEYYQDLENLVKSFVYLTRMLEEKKMTVRQLRKLLFGFKTEKLRKVLEKLEGEGEGRARSEDPSSPGGAVEGEAAGAPSGGIPPEEEKDTEGKEEKEKPKGHGRNGADDYEGAERIEVKHPSLKPGDPCPEKGCKGKLYSFEPRKFVRITGQAPVAAKVTIVAQLRCNLCLKVFTAPLPEDAEKEKYDETAGSMIALLRYGTGVPFNRLAGLEKNFKTPLAPSTQWDVVRRAAQKIMPAFKALMRTAAQDDVFYNDDTPMKILELMKEKGKGDDG